FLAIALLIALFLAYLQLRKQLRHAEQDAATRFEELKERQRAQALQIQTQQETLFNSMIEGLLLLDEDSRIQLANRAFMELCSISVDVRGKTVLEVVRQHELDKLVEAVAAQKQVL